MTAAADVDRYRAGLLRCETRAHDETVRADAALADSFRTDDPHEAAAAALDALIGYSLARRQVALARTYRAKLPEPAA